MAHCEHCQTEHDDRLKICPNSGNLFALERFFSRATILDGKYRLEDLVGVSETAVFTATHTLLNKKVAVKILFPEGDLKATTKQMIKEARAVSATGHPNIVGITDLGLSPEGALFIVMELVQGPTLAEIIHREAPLPAPRAAWIVSEILAGLAAVAKKGITHQDLKPSNVMLIQDALGQQAVKIMDFCVGRVTLADLGPDRKRPPRTPKTLTYLSPEQIRSRDDVDRRVDIYACGAILYHLLTGHPPFSADDQIGLIAEILEGEIAEPSSLVPNLDREMDRVVMKAIHSDRSRRYSSAAEFRAQLKPFLGREADDELEWSPPSGAAEESLPRRQVTLDLASPDPKEAKKRTSRPGSDAPALEETQDLELHISTNRGTPPATRRPRANRKIDLKIEAPPRRSQAPLASQELFLDLDTPELALDEPKLASPEEEMSLDLDSLESNMVALDATTDPAHVGDDLEFDLDRDRVGREQFLPGPEPDKPRPSFAAAEDDDLFRPRMDDGVESMAMLEVADTPFAGGLAPSPEAHRPARTTGASEAVRKSRHTGSAAFEGEQEDDFHRSCIWVLLIMIALGGAWAIWPDRHVLLSEVTGDRSSLKALRLTTQPEDAQVYVNGKLQERGPIRLAGDQAKLDIRVQAEGYISQTKTVKSDVKDPIKVELKRR